MSYRVETIPIFDRQFKRLSKRYASLKSELIKIVQSLRENPVQGTPIGSNCYKIRLAIASKSKGKSGGARIITHILIEGEMVLLLNIYDKSEQASLSEKELKRLLQKIP